MQIATIFAESPEVEHTLVLEKVLGQGKFHVYHAKAATLPDSDFALKVFPRNPAATVHFAREKQFLGKISHSNIISYLPIQQHNLPHDLLATEYTPNGDFFDFITEGCLTGNEKMVRTYFQQLIEGLEYLHAQSIVHLDLKLENILLDKNFMLKILDFDQAQCSEDNELHSAGTIGYRAPELIHKRYKSLKALDIYAAGVLLYVFMTGEMPFVETKTDKVKRSAIYDLFRDERERFWREKAKEVTKATFSQELKELLSAMWEENTEKRLKIEEVKRSRWYNGEVYTKEELKCEVGKVLKKVRGN